MRGGAGVLAVALAAAATLVAAPSLAAGCDPVAPPAPPGPATLTAGSGSLQLGAGETAEIDLALEIGSQRQLVDVFAVLDGSGSMEEAIGSLARSIGAAAENLSRSGIDFAVGAAYFQDLGGNAYVRLVPVAHLDCRLPEGLRSISPRGTREMHLFALHQALTGAGEAELDVPAGHDAGFRTGAFRILIHATDVAFEEGMPFTPAYGQVVDEFRAAAVTHVGIHVLRRPPPPGQIDPDGSDPAATRAALDRLGRNTGTVAPGAFDCNGDGIPDIAPGEPVTCTFDSTLASTGVETAEFGPIVEQVVQSLRPTRVEAVIEVAEPGGLEAVIRDGRAQVDPTETNRLTGRLSLGCPPEATGETHEVGLRGTLDGREVAALGLAVTCGQAPTPPPPEPAAPAVAAPAPPQPAPPPPPPPAPAAAPAAAQAPAAAAQGAPAQAAQAMPAAAIVPAPVVEGALAGERAGRDRPFLAARRTYSPLPVLAAGMLLLAAMAAAAAGPTIAGRTEGPGRWARSSGRRPTRARTGSATGRR